MEKVVAYSEISNVEELIDGYRRFKRSCEVESHFEFSAIKAIIDLEDSAKEVLSQYEYSEEVVEEIKSILDFAGNKFSHSETLVDLISDSLNVMEEF